MQRVGINESGNGNRAFQSHEERGKGVRKGDLRECEGKGEEKKRG